jgi:hypothetical protein
MVIVGEPLLIARVTVVRPRSSWSNSVDRAGLAQLPAAVRSQILSGRPPGSYSHSVVERSVPETLSGGVCFAIRPKAS